MALSQTQRKELERGVLRGCRSLRDHLRACNAGARVYSIDDVDLARATYVCRACERVYEVSGPSVRRYNVGLLAAYVEHGFPDALRKGRYDAEIDVAFPAAPRSRYERDVGI